MSAGSTRFPDDERQRERREPRWGGIDELEFRQAGPQRRAGAPSRRLLLAGGVLIALVLCVLVVVFRRPLADRLWPETRAQALREQAAAALAQGHLSAPDGSGARELYEAAIAIDPDRAEARAGLARVAQAALAQAAMALARDDFPQAHRHLALARELDVPRAQADALAARLREREAEVAGIDRLLARASQARQLGYLDGGEDAALPLYQRVLSLRPRNVEALEGREDALSELLARAHAELQSGRLEQAAYLVRLARGYDAGHSDLPQLQDELTGAVDTLRRRAERELRRGALDRAAAAYMLLLRIDLEDAAATRGLADVAQAHAARAERAAADFDFAAADAALREARTIAPGTPAVERAARRIEEARRTSARLLPAPGRRDARARVAVLLREATAAQARGDLLTPPGESAYDKLRAARALAPDSPAVRRALAQLAPEARRCFERELPRNDLGQARGCLDAWTTLEGESAATRAARRRLAQRWLAVGEERLRAGELERARAALASAVEIDAGAPGIGAFRQRLRSASASAD